MCHEATAAEGGLLEKPWQRAGMVKVEVRHLRGRVELQEKNDMSTPRAGRAPRSQ